MTIKPEQFIATPAIPAPTPGDIMNALRIRDEIAQRINRVNRSTSRGEKVSLEHAKFVAERLIVLGYIDTAKVHDAIVNDDDFEPDEDDEDGPRFPLAG